MNRQDVFLKLARDAATKSESKYKIGCVIAKKNKPLGIGYNNMSKTHPKSKTYGGFIHAEFYAILQILNNRTDCRNSTVYLYRIKSDGSMGTSYPCSTCYKLLIEFGIRDIVYTSDEQKIKRLVLPK